MDGALFVSHQHVLELVLLEQLVVNIENCATRIAEDVLDAFFLQAADDDLGTRQLHSAPQRKMITARSHQTSRELQNLRDAIGVDASDQA